MTETINRRRFPILLVTTLALLAILGTLFLPDRAQAQASVWSATLTTGKIGGSNSILGFQGLTGSLSDETFRYAGQNYEIEGLYLDQQVSSRQLFLIVGRAGNVSQGMQAAVVSD